MLDLNAYWGGWPYWPVTVRTPADLLALLDENGIQQAAVSSLKAVFVDGDAGNADAARLAEATGGRVVPWLVVNPLVEDQALRLLADAPGGPFRGFSLFPAHHGYGLDEDLPALHALLDRAQVWGWPVLVPLRLAMHFWLPSLSVDAVAGLAASYPGAPFVVGAANYEGRRVRAWLKRLPNLHVELSADAQLNAVTDYVAAAGPERVCLGTGLVLQQPAPGIAKVQSAALAPHARRLVLGDNARRLLRLDVSPP